MLIIILFPIIAGEIVRSNIDQIGNKTCIVEKPLAASIFPEN